MHTPSTRILSALAYDCGEEYDPTDPVCPGWSTRCRWPSTPLRSIGDDGPYERARQRGASAPRAGGDPAWFSAEDLIAAPWEAAEQRFV